MKFLKKVRDLVAQNKLAWIGLGSIYGIFVKFDEFISVIERFTGSSIDFVLGTDWIMILLLTGLTILIARASKQQDEFRKEFESSRSNIARMMFGFDEVYKARIKNTIKTMAEINIALVVNLRKGLKGVDEDIQIPGKEIKRIVDEANFEAMNLIGGQNELESIINSLLQRNPSMSKIEALELIRILFDSKEIEKYKLTNGIQ